MMELEVVHDTDGDRVVEGFTGTSVIEDGLAVADHQTLFAGNGVDFRKGILTLRVFVGHNRAGHAGKFHAGGDIFLRCAVEYGRHDLPAQLLGGNTEMNLQHLTDVHSGRYAQRIQDDVERGTVRQERHILRRQNAGHNTLVAVTTCHLIADGDFSLLCDIDADNFVDSRRQLIAVLA